jgi:hypothetical protein
VRDSRWAALAGLAAAAVLLPSLAYGFVYDDHRFVEGNPHLADPSILWRAFSDPACQTADGTHAGLWRPLRTLSFALDRALFGGSPAGPHAVNLALHAAGTSLVFAMLRRFGAGVVPALLGALAYGLHPAQVEVAGWISSRGDLLAAALVWGAIVCDLGGRARTALALGLAGCLAKEQAVVWPLLTLLAGRLAGRCGREALRPAASALLVVAAFVAARQLLLEEPAQEGGLGAGAAGPVRLAAMLGHQAWTALLPVGLTFDWQMPASAAPFVVVAFGAAALAAAVWRPTRLPAVWFLAALLPTLFVQAVLPLNILVADRFLLFALPALSVVVAHCAGRGALAPAAAAVVCLGSLQHAQVPVWRDDASLWSATASREPAHWRANAWLGSGALARGEWDEAARRLRTAAETGDDAAAWVRYAQALEEIAFRDRDAERTVEARSAYTRAIALFERPRAEGRGALLPAARLGAAEMSLVLGDDAAAAASLRALASEEPPAVPSPFAEAFRRRVARVASAVETRLGDRALADALRAWGDGS